MHRLFLLRHAAAGWAAPGLRDFDRPLTEKGRADAAAVGLMMHERGYLPDVVICSPSVRTRQTWECVAAGLGTAEGTDIRYIVSDALYHGDANSYLEVIREAPTVAAILVVGHNPMLAELAVAIPGYDRAASTALTDFPQAAFAVFSFAEPLAHLKHGTLEAFLRV